MRRKRPSRAAGEVRVSGGTASLVAAGILLIAGAQIWYLAAFFHDDAFIILRYAANLRGGFGPVWNPGEPVEGYTSPLWVALCALLPSLGISITDAPRVLGILSLAGLLVAMWRESNPAGRLAALVIASNGAVIAWALGGLETAAFTLFLTCSLLPFARTPDNRERVGLPGAGIALALAYLSRPEALLFGAAAVLYLAFEWRRSARYTPRDITRFALPAAITLGVHVMWRRYYYGEWLPNTYFVKGGLEPAYLAFGVGYVGRFIIFQAPVLLLLGWHLWMRRVRNGRAATLAAIVLYGAYVCTAGDHMQWYRLFVPVMPLLYLLALSERASSHGGRAVVATVCVFAAWNLAATAYHGERGWKLRDPAAYYGTLVGMYIHEHWPPGALVALNTAGSAAFYSEHRCIDMLGLNDKHIARSNPPPDPGLPWTQLPGHRKGDGRYVLSRRPDFIILGGAEGYAFPWFHGDKDIVQDPEFARLYRLEAVPIAGRVGAEGVIFQYFRRTDALD